MLFNVIGVCFVGLAMLGVLLPVLPTTPFLLVAAACFAKSSPRLHKKLLENKIFGPMILHWQQTRSIPKRAKIVSLFTMILSAAWSCYILTNVYLCFLIIALMAWPFMFVLRLPIAKE